MKLYIKENRGNKDIVPEKVGGLKKTAKKIRCRNKNNAVYREFEGINKKEKNKERRKNKRLKKKIKRCKL